MKCKNCSYYVKEIRKFVSAPDETIGRCFNPALISDVTANVGECPINGLYATCDEGRGELEVGEDFGCIHFEQKL